MLECSTRRAETAVELAERLMLGVVIVCESIEGVPSAMTANLALQPSCILFVRSEGLLGSIQLTTPVVSLWVAVPLNSHLQRYSISMYHTRANLL
jgi:hypothetical protein